MQNIGYTAFPLIISAILTDSDSYYACFTFYIVTSGITIVLTGLTLYYNKVQFGGI